MLVLTGGAGSRDASSLPGRLHWKMSLKGMGLQLAARQDCCINGELLLGIKPGLGRMEISIDSRADWLARLPASVLAGLGTPWNTLQLGGSLRLSAREFRLETVQGRWRQFGDLQFDLLNLSSRVSTVAPLGSYRLNLAADPGNPGVSTLRLLHAGRRACSSRARHGRAPAAARAASSARPAPRRAARKRSTTC